MVRLSDLQRVLLSAAAQRADGSLLPPPDNVGGQAVRIARTIPVLIKHGLVSEVDVSEPSRAWRHEGDRAVGAFITDAGRLAIGDEPATPPANVPVPLAAAAPAAPKANTKAGRVVALLRRDQGATIDELIAATGWLPHTTRAALTGLRKKGHSIARSKRGEATCYTIAPAA